MPSSTFPNDTAERQIVLFGVSDGSINQSGIIMMVGSYLTLARHINEQDALNLQVYLFLGWLYWLTVSYLH
jgi:hypothetical protein